MTLRLSLVIEGDAAGARKALDDTSRAVARLGEEAGKAAGPTGDTAEALAEAGRQGATASGVIEDTAIALGDAGRGGVEAAAGIGRAGEAAGAAAGRMGTLRAAAIGAIGGLLGGLALTAVSQAIGGLVSAAAGYVRELVDSTPSIERALGRHETLVDDVTAAFRRARGAASDYGLVSREVLTFEAQQDVARLGRALGASARGLSLPSVAELVPSALGATGVEVRETFGPFEGAVRRFREGLRQGRVDVIAFRTEVSEIASELAQGSPFRVIAEGILETTDKAGELQAELARARDLLAALQGNADAAGRALGERVADGLRQTSDAAGTAAGQLAAVDRLLATIAGRTAPITGPAPALPGPLQPFASGGIVSQPTLFRFGRGEVGLMGEGGPEAIMPLRQTPRGLAVEAAGNGGATTLPVARLASGNLGVVTPFAAGGVVSGITPFAAGGVVVNPAGGGAFGGLATELRETIRAMDHLRTTAKGTLSGIASDLRAGAGAAEIFANALGRLSERFLDLALDHVVTGLFGARGTPGGGIFGDLFAGIVASAHGNAFQGGDVVPFRNGGIVSQPTLFPLRGGRVGLMSEVGDEAILPLARTRDGSLGVRAEISGGATVNHFHIQTPDPRAFAESRAQVLRGASRLVQRAARYA